MKLNAIQRDVQSSGMLQVAQATIKATRKVFDIFADKTYSNKPEAIFRELVANGIDAQKLNGMEHVPVEVILPTELDPTCIVKDCGPGMSHIFIMGDPDANPPVESKFMAFTDASTKDADNTAIGGFGIGSKSPLSYVDQFTLRVVHEGVLSVYTLYRNDIGIPEIGLQGQTTTDEPSGVQVSFPVETSDVQTFHAAAQNALQYFLPLPTVVNGTITAPDYTYVGDNWAMRREAGPLGVIMGGVRYPVTTNSLEWSLRQNVKLKPLLDYGLDLTLPIGAAAVALSREQLDYIPVTTAGIAAGLTAVIDDVVATFATIFDTQPTLWDAMQALANEAPEGRSYSGRAQFLLANAKYKGEKLERSFKPIGAKAEDKMWEIPPLSASRRGRKAVGSAAWNVVNGLRIITPGAIGRVIVDDLPISPKSKTLMRIRTFVEGARGERDGSLILRAEDGDTARLLAVFNSPTEYILTSSLPEPVSGPRYSRGPMAVRPKVRMFTFDGSRMRGRYGSERTDNLSPGDNKRGVEEILYANQPASGIMVTMSSFALPRPDVFYKNMASGLIQWSDLVFVNEGDAVKIKDNFTDFWVEFDKRLKNALAANPQLAHRLAIAREPRFKRLFDAWVDMPQYLTAAQAKRPFGKVVSLYEKYVKPLDDEQEKLAPFITPALPKGINPAIMVEAFQKEQADADLLLDIIKFDKPRQVELFVKNL